VTGQVIVPVCRVDLGSVAWIMVVVSDEPQPSYEDLAALVAALQAEIADLKAS
jgi:hypothetical protein